ncbi:hypothetical protein ACEWY4_011692 [Coilia grayii]|uniref:RUN domain-containing protein n=1 Tax=Coilia grayii TaxID=363190 RepID=A0ABD1JYD7_9TELE
MNSPPKLAGETLIVHHIPLVHCQVSSGGGGGGGGRPCCGSLKRGNPFSPPENLGLSRTTSLPERDVLLHEPLVYSSLIQTSSGSLSSSDLGLGEGLGEGDGQGGKDGRQEGGGRHGGEGRAGRGGRRGGGRGGEGSGGGSVASDASFTSSNSEDHLVSSHTHEGSGFGLRERAKRQRHNPFLLNREDEEEEEDDDDNLNGYMEDSSFHLHGSTNDALNNEMGLPPFHLHELDYQPEPFLLHGNQGKPWFSSSGGPRRMTQSSDGSRGGGGTFELEGLGLLALGAQRRHGSSGSTLSMDCGEHDWGEEEEEEEEEEEDEDQPMRSGRSSQGGSSSSGSSVAQRCSCCRLSQPHYPEPFVDAFPDCPPGYASDSSCNSSDGVLVNFSTIYNKMNNVVPTTTTTTTKAHHRHQAHGSSSTEQTCTSPVSDVQGGSRVGGIGGVGPGGTRGGSSGGAFYLDLHTSPTDPPEFAQAGGAPVPHEPAKSTSSPRSLLTLSQQQQLETLELDANCNSYHHLHHQLHQPGVGEGPGEGEVMTAAGDATSRHQSQARLVVATQNYYKLVTCDLSSQSSPSPAGSSVTSCSEEHSKGSPTQPSEYYLFRQAEEEEEEVGEVEGEEGEDEFRLAQQGVVQSEEGRPQKLGTSASAQNIIEGQVYVNVSPPVGHQVGGAPGRPRSRSYDRNLDKSPPARLGSLERMLSCPVRLSEGATPSPMPPPRVTSFAEIARNKRRTVGGGGGGAASSPCLRAEASVTHSIHSHSSGEFSPILEDLQQGQSHSLPPLSHCYSQSSCDTSPAGHRGGALRDSPGAMGREPRTKAEGGLSSSTDSLPAVVRYSKDQRPTTLPIQPFTFQHQFQRSQKPLLPLLSEYVSQMQARGATAPEGGEDEPDEEPQPQQQQQHLHHPRHQPQVEAPSSVRPSPLGSYSPVRLHGAPSVSTCSTCSPSPERGCGSGSGNGSVSGFGIAMGRNRPPRSLSCPISAGLHPNTLSHSPPGDAAAAAAAAAPTLQGTDTQGNLTPLPHTPPPPPGVRKSPVPAGPPHGRPGVCLHRTSLPPLTDLSSLPPAGMGTLESNQQQEAMKNIMPGYGAARPANAHSMRQFQQCYSDFLPDYFSQTERPPEEFCLSPDASPDEASISVDLQQKRGLVKAVNTAVDLIVAHFGTSRDPGVKAKLGNSSVSPNVGHLILKYLCPAIREILHDGLRSYLLDLIIGQRRNQPWTVVEASTQLGPSTRVLHSLFTKVSQYSELTSHSMRLNAFIFGLLNLRSLEFWFNHMYTHEDVVATHYHPWGFLPLSQGACQSLFEELLLLLQPLSLLPFDLDLLFEPRLLQKDQEHLRRKEQLCSAGLGLDQSARSTFQLMRGRGVAGAESIDEEETGLGRLRESSSLSQDGAWQRTWGGASKRCSSEPRRLGSGSQEPGLAKPTSANDDMDLWRRRGASRGGERVKGVGEEWPEADPPSSQAAMGAGATDVAKQRSRQAGWWYQLMQSSQVYIDNSTEGSKFVKWEKRKKSTSEGRRQSHPPPREGVVEGAEASQGLEEGRVLGRMQERRHHRRSNSSSSSTSSGSSTSCQPSCPATDPKRAPKAKSTWMGSPPESVLTELKKSQAAEPERPERPEAVSGTQTGAAEESPAQGMRWGRLFGASTTTTSEKSEPKSTRSQKSRFVSSALAVVIFSI